MGDKQDAARVAWATIKLTQVGRRPVILDQLAIHVGLPVAETAELLRLIWRERVDLHDGMIRLDATPAGPRRYRVHAGGRPVGAGKGCNVDMYLLALALGRPIHAVATCPATGTRSRWTSPPRGWSASTRPRGRGRRGPRRRPHAGAGPHRRRRLRPAAVLRLRAGRVALAG